MDQTNNSDIYDIIENLKLYKKHCIRIVIIHTVYKFKQPPWLATQIK